MRCYKLINFLISYEIISLFTPDRVKLDPFAYLLVRGGAQFQTTCSPQGHLYFSEKVFRLTNILERTFNKQKCDQRIGKCYSRLRDCLRLQLTSHLMVGEDQYLTFFQVW